MTAVGLIALVVFAVCVASLLVLGLCRAADDGREE